ncbi:MAG: hypothetical protein HY774_19495 [Acidobacteria bacterium]|nr:hypothetical protein [Acidobacteriota bacterium]
MRQLPPRKPLPPRTQLKLAQETTKIKDSAEPQKTALARYKNARDCKWFIPVTDTLKELAAPGERCMFCSSNEPSQVEHYRPKAIFPTLTFVWENYLWACGICNLAKLDQFPTEEHQRLINPLDENVWDYFLLDEEHGQPIARWDVALNDKNPRAVKTLEILNLEREGLERPRKARLKNLKQQINDSLRLLDHGDLTREDLRQRIQDWRQEPLQPDIADYFLNGPGKAKEPFRTLFQVLEA